MTRIKPVRSVPAPRRRGSAWASCRACVRPGWSWALAVVLAWPISSRVDAQEFPGIPVPATANSGAELDPASPDAIASRSALVAAESRALDRTLENAGPATVKQLLAVGERLRALSELLEKQRALASRQTAVEELPWASPDSPSIYDLNALYEAQFARGPGEQQLDDLLTASREALAAAKEKLATAERERRGARNELEEAPADSKATAKDALQLRELDSRIAQEEVFLRRAEMVAAQRAIEDPAINELQERIETMRVALASGAGDSTSALGALMKRASELRRWREGLERGLAAANLNLEAAQRRYVQRPEPSAELLEQMEWLTARRDALRDELALADAQAERFDSQKEMWRHWEATLRGVGTRDELETWKSEAQERIADLRQAELQLVGRASDLRVRLEKIESQLSEASEGFPRHGRLGEELEALSHLQQKQREEAAALAADRRMSERVLEDIQERTGRFDPLEYAKFTADAARDIWKYEIATVDDASITVGSLVLALLFFVIGIWAARRGSALVELAAKKRFKLDAGAAHALHTLSFYVLLVAFSLLALRAIHFPLTAFTVLGGALAIGVGFGSQNVMNNFISGLILMLERPVRAHDLIEVDGNHGTIEKIGARSTQIRSTDGRHIIVPNSFFLESNVVNWTLSDDLIRAKVSVGVNYGSPTDLVEKLIHQAIQENERVLKIPSPVVVFEAFGDNSLNFDVHFWVKARSPMGVRTVQSQVRFRIDDLFRKNQLVIAFPQRDVHIDSATPIEVRVLTEHEAATPSPKPDPE